MGGVRRGARCGDRVVAFLDDGLSGTVVRGLPVLAPEKAEAGAGCLVGIADPQVREQLGRLLDERGLSPASVIHPRAIIAPEMTLGDGCLVLGGAHVSSIVRIGSHVQVHCNATVVQDTVLRDRVTVYPGANVSGSATLEENVTVGSSAVVLQGLTVGRGTFIGAGAVVTRSLGPDLVVAGVPARPLDR